MALAFDPPVIINCRDRVTPLRALVDWLERAGHERIVLLDNASTYPELLDYLDKSPHEVIRGVGNLGAQALWKLPQHEILIGTRPFVYTDPDCVPIDDCPLDAVEFLHELLERYPHAPKAGLGLYTDDVYDPQLLKWERDTLLNPEPNGRWKGRLGYALSERPGPLCGAHVFDSWIDTTFALYRPGTQYGLPALRTGLPYQCRHISPSWYPEDPLSDENQYYLDRAEGGPLYSGWKGQHGRRRA